MAHGRSNIKRRIGLVLCVMGAALVLAAAGLVAYNGWLTENGGEQGVEALDELKQAIEENAGEGEVSADEPALIRIGGYDYLGYLSIPELGLELPVMAEWDLDRLSIAPCRYSGGVATDDLVICAHNFRKHFGRLKNLSLGAAVYFTDATGAVFGYEAVSSEVLGPYNIADMVESDYDLTLFTCTYGGQTRFVLRCRRS